MNRKTESQPGKSSFSASPQSLRQERHAVKTAIDESLSSVRFNAGDMRAVLKSTRTCAKRTNAKRRRSRFKPDLVFAFALVAMVALPLSLYALRSRENITSIVTAPGEVTPNPILATMPDADIVSPLPPPVPTSIPTVPSQTDSVAALSSGLISESEAIRAARSCFEAQCDTTIFSFDEYEISAVLRSGDIPQYTITMESIYKNGCSFTMILNAETGEVLQYSTPQLATVPSYMDSASPEVRAWFDKYGEHLFTWPQDVQAEFSRRYEGGTLRTARDGEITYEQAINAVSAPISAEAPGLFTAFYPVLYSERASSTGRSFYLVYCYASQEESVLSSSTPMTVSFDAQTGDILSIEGNPLDHPFSISSVDTGE